MLPRELRYYLISRFCSGTAMTLMRAAILWHVFALSGSAFHLGLIGLVQFIPALFLNLVGGAVADTYDRRRIIMIAQVVPLICGTVLALTTHHGVATLPLLYEMIFCIAVAASFDNPARASLLPMLVSREAFPRAVTYASTVQALAFVTGPASQGIIIGSAGIAAAYAGYSALIVGSISGLALLRPHSRDGPRREVSLHAVREGLAFVRHHQVVLGCMTLDMFAVIFGGATAVL